MKFRGLAITMGVGAAAGAIAVMMMPKNSPGRMLANKAAEKVEDVAMQVGDKIANRLDM